MTDEHIDRLDRYFVAMRIHERYGLTFERFVSMVDAGTWRDVVA